ncbi:hypothetical protein [Promicromonospora iranensis]|uniref:hypothetical protein n=1 Tax=Promicromonospora iranensis TaxID=1105144 RepID=UPI0023A9FA97|nr:hypothetical protein [Promicromonospora iranensis]
MVATYQEIRLTRAFVDAVEDLRVRTRLNASEYDVGQAAGLLRRLLTDSSPLGPRAAKLVGFSPEFRWFVAYGHEVRASGSLQWELDPVAVTALNLGDEAEKLIDESWTRRGSHHDLLGTPLFSLGSPEITLKWLVRHVAHDEGGVHVGMSKDTPERLRRVYESKDRLILVWTLKALGRVVVRGYEPLVMRLVRMDPLYGIAPGPE